MLMSVWEMMVNASANVHAIYWIGGYDCIRSRIFIVDDGYSCCLCFFFTFRLDSDGDGMGWDEERRREEGCDRLCVL